MRSALDKLLSSTSSLRFLRYVVESRIPPDHLGRHCYSGTCFRVQKRSQSSAAQPSVSFVKEQDSGEKRLVFASRFNLAENELWQATQPIGSETASLSDWIRFVQFRQRRHGDVGVKEVWRAIREGKFELRLEGDAVFLWETFLGCPSTVKEAMDHAIELMHQNPTSTYFRGAYITAMRTLIDMRALDIEERHRSMLEAFPPGPDIIPKMKFIFHIDPWLSDWLWKKVRSDFERKGYRDDTSDSNRNTKHRDSASVSKTGHINHESSTPKDQQSTYVDQLRDRTTVAPSEDLFIDPSSIKGVLGTEPFNRFLGKMNNIQPKTIDDAFVARLFATRSFTMGLVIRGLSMFSVEAIGPLALREMVVRAQQIDQIEAKFTELHEAGISIQPCVYCDSVRMFVRQGETRLLWNLLNSDLHPDEYEDSKKLHSLLLDYSRNSDGISVQRILSILSMKFKDPTRTQWNELFKFHLHHSPRSEFLRFTEEMLGHGIGPASTVINEFLAVMLPRRKRSHGPTVRSGSSEDLALVCNLFRRLLETGVARFSPLRWREIFKRLGMAGQHRELHHLMLWLADYYSPWSSQHGLWKIKRNNRGFISLDPGIPVRGSYPELQLHKLPHSSPWWVPKDFQILHSPKSRPTIHVTPPMWQSSQEAFQQLFPPLTQAVLIEWSFKMMHPHLPNIHATLGPRLLPSSDARSEAFLPSSNSDHCHVIDNFTLQKWRTQALSPALGPLVRTLRLLLALRSRGVAVHTRLVRSRIRLRLWILFGPSPGRVKANLMSAQRLTISLVEIVRVIQDAWPGGVFELEETVLERLLTKHGSISKESNVQAKKDAETFMFAVFGNSNQAGWKPAKKDSVSMWPRRRRTNLFGRRRITTRVFLNFLLSQRNPS